MDISSRIKFENNVFICLTLDCGKLRYELEYDENIYDGEPYDVFSVYKKQDTGKIKYKTDHYEKVSHSPLTKNKPLKCGSYLFQFNKTKIHVEFTNSIISYELEDDGIKDDSDLC